MAHGNIPRIVHKPHGEPWSSIVPSPVRFGSEHIAAAAGLLRALDVAYSYGAEVTDAEREIAQEMYCADVSSAMNIGIKVDSVLPREDGHSWFDFMLVTAFQQQSAMSARVSDVIIATHVSDVS